MTFNETFDALVEVGADFDIVSEGKELAQVEHDRVEDLWTVKVLNGAVRTRMTVDHIDSVRVNGDEEGYAVFGWDGSLDLRPSIEDAPLLVSLAGEPTVSVLRPDDMPVNGTDIEALVEAYSAYNEAKMLASRAFNKWRDQVVAVRRLIGLEDDGTEKDGQGIDMEGSE